MVPRMIHLLVLLWSLVVSPEDAEALRKTAPNDLTFDAAQAHLSAARLAASVENVDADLLLSIAWHESRYVATARTAEPGNKVSCGVMTPVPKATCTTPTLIDGYLQGAAHLREWLDAAHGNERVALLGYAGGYKMIRACATGTVMVERQGRDVDLCTVVNIFQWRARAIRQARAKLAAS